MTICLALICSNHKGVVAVSDRMVSDESLSLEAEQSTRKMQSIGRDFAALTAGDALAHTDLLRQAAEDLSETNQPTVREVAQVVEETFIQERKSLAEKSVLRRIGLDYDTFLDRQRDLAPEVTSTLVTELQLVELGLEILIAGMDSSGAHLYRIEDPGIAICCDSIGYAAIGSGLPHAEGFLAEADYSPQIPLNKAIWLAYVAKRRSERAPGVGSRFTDILTIEPGKGVRYLGSGAMEGLAEIYQGYLKQLIHATNSMDQSIYDMPLDYEEEA